MKEVNFNTPLLNLDGSPIEDATVGKIVANIIATESKGDALKIFGWAVNLSRGESIILDDSDLTVFKSLIKDNDRMTVLVKAQALKLLEEAKEFKKEKTK